MKDSRPTDPPAEDLRPPPRVIHVPPPCYAWHWAPAIALPVGGLVSFIGLFHVFEGASKHPVGTWYTRPEYRSALVVICVAVALSMVAAMLTEWCRRCSNRRRADFCRQHPAEEQDPVSVELAGRVQKGTLGFNAKLRRVFETHGTATETGARIVSVGVLDVPEPGPHRFEPMIVVSRRSSWRLVGLCYWLGPVILIPGASLVFGWRPTSPLAAALATPAAGLLSVLAVYYLWTLVLRRIYVRIAPGRVQFMQYHFGASWPRIADFPMDADTFVFARRTIPWTWVEFEFHRGDRHRSVRIRNTQAEPDRLERVWKAILSTAPTPPMSHESLVG